MLNTIVRTMIPDHLRKKLRSEIASRQVGRYRLTVEEKRLIANRLKTDYQHLKDRV